ncbi:MAG: DnaD domain protein [Eubacterium sp.]|nr:DnaD domain protein [Eubacterium sp.]
MNITISSEKKETFSEISNNFIDYYMVGANGDFVKVYLYLVRLYSCGRPVSVSDIADYFQCTENDVCRAIRYWVKEGILSFTYDTGRNITGIILKNIEAPEILNDQNKIVDFTTAMLDDGRNAVDIDEMNGSFGTDRKRLSVSVSDEDMDDEDAPESRRTAKAVSDSRRVNDISSDNRRAGSRAGSERHIDEVDIISGDAESEIDTYRAPEKKKIEKNEIDQKLTDENFQDLVSQAQAYFNRNLSQPDINMLIYVYDELKLPTDLMEYLLEYCATIGKTKCNYVERVAINWYEMGIRDRKAAKEYTDTFNSMYRTIFKELGITNRAVPTPAEMAYIKVWQNEFGYNEDVIGEACRRAIITRPNSATFAYVNGILERWHKDGVKNYKDIEDADSRYEKGKKKAAGSDSRLGLFGDYKQSSSDDEWNELTKMYIKEVNDK